MKIPSEVLLILEEEEVTRDKKEKYSIELIAAHIVDHINKEGYSVSKIKLQMLLFYTAGVFLHVYNKSIIFNGNDSISTDELFINKRSGPINDLIFNKTIEQILYTRYFNSKSFALLRADYGDDQFCRVLRSDCLTDKDKVLINSLVDSYREYSWHEMVDKFKDEGLYLKMSRGEIYNNEKIITVYDNLAILFG